MTSYPQKHVNNHNNVNHFKKKITKRFQKLLNPKKNYKS